MSNISNIKSLERAVQEIFFNQQFIIQSLVADYSNYWVVTYIQKETTWKIKLKRRKEKKRKEKPNKRKDIQKTSS